MNKLTNPLVISIIGVVIIVGAGITYVTRMQQPIEREGIEGIITQLDPLTRAASLEIMHPKTGRPIEIEGEVAADCLILRDGQQISMADLEPGVSIKADGLLYPLSRRIVATRVEVVPAAAGTESESDAEVAESSASATSESATSESASSEPESPESTSDDTEVTNS